MQTLTKEFIMSLISEQVTSMELDEMPNIPNELWRVVNNQLDPPKEFKLSDFKNPQEVYDEYRQKSLISKVPIISLDPQIKSGSMRSRDTKYNFATEEELIPDVAICYEVRENIHTPNFKLYAFDNYGYKEQKVTPTGEKVYQKFKMFVWVDDTNPNVALALFRNLPRNTFFSTSYQQQAEPQYTSETYTKKYLHFKRINELFTREDIKVKLYSCGLPPIMAFKKFARPITHKINDEKYSAPNYNFLLSGMWPASDVQTAMDLIIQYRAAVAIDDPLPEMPEATHMPRNEKFPQSYAGGHWKGGQKIAGAEAAQQTEKLRLWMKAIAGGELSFYIGTDLQIIGTITDNTMVMTATFSSVSQNRSAGENWADYKIEPITPISVNVQIPIPENISLADLEDNDLEMVRGGIESEEFKFLNQMYDQLLEKLGNEILAIDDSAAIDKYLMFEPEDVELDLDESIELNETTMKKTKRVKVTGKQLKFIVEQKRLKHQLTKKRD